MMKSRITASLAAVTLAAVGYLALPSAAPASAGAGHHSVAAAPATRASNAYIHPGNQSRAHTATAYWTGHWSGTGTYSGSFNYGDGTADNFAQASLSRAFNHGSPYPCLNTSYVQRLNVMNAEGSAPQATSNTIWSGGNPC